jgi:hypothetical protein
MIWWKEPESICALNYFYQFDVYQDYERNRELYPRHGQSYAGLIRGFNDAIKIRKRLGIKQHKYKKYKTWSLKK